MKYGPVLFVTNIPEFLVVIFAIMTEEVFSFMENVCPAHLEVKIIIMAEIIQSGQQGNGPRKVRVKKMSTKIDMTPMVDLAFLLLTFFILTSTFNHFNMMSLRMPEKPETVKDQPLVHERNVLNVALGKDNTVYWWPGFESQIKKTDYSSTGIRNVLLEKKASNDSLVVLVKPMDDSRYENMVDILDEMAIANVTSYAIVEFTKEDESKIKQP